MVKGFQDLCEIYAVKNNKVTREANVFVWDYEINSLIGVQYFDVTTGILENENLARTYHVETARIYVQDFEA